MSWAIWITGLPGSGKTTLAGGAAEALPGRGVPDRAVRLPALRRACPRELGVDRERAVRWCRASGAAARGGAAGPVAPPDVAPDYEHALAPELTLRTDRQDAWSAIEAVLRLAHQLQRSASGASHR